MQTLSLTRARQNLTHFVRRALRGEDIGLVCDGRVIALRPVEVYSDDYALREYGVSAAQLDRVIQAIDEETAKAKAAGTVRVFKGRL